MSLQGKRQCCRAANAPQLQLLPRRRCAPTDQKPLQNVSNNRTRYRQVSPVSYQSTSDTVGKQHKRARGGGRHLVSLQGKHQCCRAATTPPAVDAPLQFRNHYKTLNLPNNGTRTRQLPVTQHCQDHTPYRYGTWYGRGTMVGEVVNPRVWYPYRTVRNIRTVREQFAKCSHNSRIIRYFSHFREHPSRT